MLIIEYIKGEELFILETKSCCCNSAQKAPQKLLFGLSDYFKVIFSWIFAFKRTFIVEPGLYFTGDNYNIDSPLLVTCNYHMTVFVLWRILKRRDTRILVINTQGINVWCSSGKGQFSANEIIKQLNRYDRNILSKSDNIELVLPKLSLSGVSIAELKDNMISPKIGPVYASELPIYLDDLPLKNCNSDKFRFSLKDRLFTLIPSLAQMIKYGIYIGIIFFIWHYFFHTNIYWQVLPIFAIVIILFVIFFPVLPTKTFALKGIFLFLPLAVILSVYYFIFNRNLAMDLISYVFYMSFLAGTCLFFALSYTGNSGVSNYSLVRKETARYLPVTVLIYIVSIASLIIKGVL
jgi:hypothetical protein